MTLYAARTNFEAITVAAHALRDAATRKHLPIGLHLVVPALIRTHGQLAGMPGPRKRRAKCDRDQVGHVTPGHAMGNDPTVIQVHAGRQIELVPVHVELCDICHSSPQVHHRRRPQHRDRIV